MLENERLRKEQEEADRAMEVTANESAENKFIFDTDDFDLDAAIQVKRTSEKKSRSNSIEKKEVSEEDKILAENAARKGKYVNYDLS